MNYLGAAVEVDGQMESVVDFTLDLPTDKVFALCPHLSAELYPVFLDYARKLHWESGSKRFYAPINSVRAVEKGLNALGISVCFSPAVLIAAKC